MAKVKRIYSIFSDGICGYIYQVDGIYFERVIGFADFQIANLDNYLLTLIYRGFTIKTF